MPEFFLELFSEEIPARMQALGDDELELICATAFGHLDFAEVETFAGPRRIGISGKLNATDGGGGSLEIKGPRISAPEAALNGFAKKYRVSVSDLISKDGSYFLKQVVPEKTAREIIETELPAALSKFRWPKSMRWGQSEDFTWVRPLRRVICLLDGEIIPIKIGPVTASNQTEGHRFLAPSPFTVSSREDWKKKLRSSKVLVEQSTRIYEIIEGLKSLAEERNLTVVNDDALFQEVAGLVEWPVPLIGSIGTEFMDLPPEVRELSMKVNQKYFAMRDAAGKPAPYFAFVSNMEATDGGAAIIAGNERVLRARLSDAMYFWDLDLKTPLDALLPKLDKITFHAKIGTQGQRAERISDLATEIAQYLAADGLTSKQAGIAGLLCKADLVTGMVGEFPELQGVMGGYYAEKNPGKWDGAVVGSAIKTHYQPKGPSDAVPTGTVAVSVALADKLDTLVQFFENDEKPTGSSDPYALRRAALGVIRIILENKLSLRLKLLIGEDTDLFAFIIERLRVKLRGEGKRFDVLDAVIGARFDDELTSVIERVEAVSIFLSTTDGANLLTAYRRAANILRIEDAKDGENRHLGKLGSLNSPEADSLSIALDGITSFLQQYDQRDYDPILKFLAQLRAPVDNFFDKVTVNDADPELRRNRLQLLAKLRDTMHLIADFSKIEG